MEFLGKPGNTCFFLMVMLSLFTVGLLVSLVEAFWILPSHVVNSTKKTLSPSSHLKNWRSRWIHNIRIKYTRSLAYVFRHPKRFLIASFIALALSIGLVVTEKVRIEFFTFDPIRLLYVNVNMPTDSPIQSTLEQTERVERIIRPLIQLQHIYNSTIKELNYTARLKSAELQAPDPPKMLYLKGFWQSFYISNSLAQC